MYYFNTITGFRHDYNINSGTYMRNHSLYRRATLSDRYMVALRTQPRGEVHLVIAKALSNRYLIHISNYFEYKRVGSIHTLTT